MNKYFYALVFLGVIGVFGGILYISQSDSLVKGFTSNNNMPTLPPDSSVLKVITPAAQESQQGQSVQQQSPQTQSAANIEGPMKASYSATIKTTKGDIELTLFGDQAPKAVQNFITKAQGKYYINLSFHRVEDWVIQGGDPYSRNNSGTVGTGGSSIQTELTATPFVMGSLGMAASGDMPIGQGARISNDSQFFIVKKDASWLNQQYTNFGVVTKGMDVVNNIQVGDKILGINVE